MTTNSFLRLGHAAQRQKITRYQVLGERSSGTNLLNLAMKRSLELSPSKLMGWKHSCFNTLAIPSDMLIVVVTRNAFSWARSMHSKPWHTTAELQSLAFSDFIRAKWNTTVDRADYFGLKKPDQRIGMPLQLDRHPITGAMFDNIFHMRNVKTAAWLGLAARDCNFAILQLETFQTNSQKVIEELATTFDVAQSGPVRPIIRRLGSRFKPKVKDRPMPPQNISGPDQEFILSQLDLSQEETLGYSY